MKSIPYCFMLLCFALLLTSCHTHKHTYNANNDVSESEYIYSHPYQKANYINGGDTGLQRDLYTTLSKAAPLAQECMEGRAFVSFTILEDGIIDPNSIKLMRNSSVPEDYITAAIEAIKNLGKFEPAKFNNMSKRVRYGLAIRYPIPLEYIKANE